MVAVKELAITGQVVPTRTRPPPFVARNGYFRPERVVGLIQMFDPYQCTVSANHGSVGLVT